jgi:hypothetical protein
MEKRGGWHKWLSAKQKDEDDSVLIIDETQASCHIKILGGVTFGISEIPNAIPLSVLQCLVLRHEDSFVWLVEIFSRELPRG